MHLNQVPEDASPKAQEAFECAPVACTLEEPATEIAVPAQKSAKETEALAQNLLNIENSNIEEEEEEEEDQDQDGDGDGDEDETVDFGYESQEENDEAALDHVLKIQENSPD